MKLVVAYIHHVCSAKVVDALRDAGCANISLLDVKGTLRALSDSERVYSADAAVVISEVQLSLVCKDILVDKVTRIIRTEGHIGAAPSGWIFVSPIEQVLPIDGG